MTNIEINPPHKPDGWLQAVLDYDIFDGDFGDGSERQLLNVVRIAKRGGVCRECEQAITKGMLVRVIKMADSEGFYGGRCCEPCCDAQATMTLDPEDCGDAVTARHALRRDLFGTP